MKAKSFQINMTEKSQEKDLSLSAFESGLIADIHPETEYVASIKISRQPNGKILGASVFIPGEFVEGIVETAESVKLKISLYNNNIILSV